MSQRAWPVPFTAVTMSEAYTAGLFDICFRLATRLFDRLHTSTFDEEIIKSELQLLYTFVAKYLRLWSARCDTDTYKQLVALEVNLRAMESIGDAYVGTRVAKDIVANADHLRELGRCIRRTSVAGRTTTVDRNMFVQSMVRLGDAIGRAMDDRAPGAVKAWKALSAAKKVDKAALKREVLLVLESTRTAARELQPADPTDAVDAEDVGTARW